MASKKTPPGYGYTERPPLTSIAAGTTSRIAAPLRLEARRVNAETVRPKYLAPTVEVTSTGSSTDLEVSLAVTDPQARVTRVEFRTKEGSAEYGPWTEVPGPSPYVQTVTKAGFGSYIDWRIIGYDADLHAEQVLREGSSKWPVNLGMSPVVMKLTRAGFNSGSGKYEIWYRYYLENGDRTRTEDPLLGFVTSVGPTNVKDQTGAAATGVTRQHDPKEADGWRASWDSTATQQWSFELSAVGLSEGDVTFPEQDPYLRTRSIPYAHGTATFIAPASSPGLTGGDVVGPAASTDNAVAAFDGVTGKLLQNRVVTISDTGAVAGVSTLAAATSVTAPSFIGTADEAILADVALLANEASALEVQLNGTYLRWRNGADSADLNVMRVIASNVVEIEAPAGAAISLRINAVGIVSVNFAGMSVTGALTTSGTINGQTISSAANFDGSITVATTSKALILISEQSGWTTHYSANATGSYVNALGVGGTFRVLLNSVTQVTFGTALNTFVQKAQFNAGVLVQGLAGSGTRPVAADASGNLVITTAGSGDVTGPGSATDNAIARFNLTSGKVIQNSSATISDAGQLNATSYAVGGTPGDSGTIDTAAGTWEITVSGGLITSIVQTS